MTSQADPTFFRTAAEFRKWLTRNASKTAVLWVGFHKVDSGLKSITYPEALDEALCFGWIDGVRKKLNDTSYIVRFTPRKKASYWSAVNIRRAKELEARGKMTDAGMKAFRARDEETARYSYELRRKGLTPEYEQIFRKRPRAWEFFHEQAPWYRRTISFWVVSAKREETRLKRLNILIEESEENRRLGMLTPPSKKDKKNSGG